MFNKFLLHFNFYFIRILLIGAILFSGGVLGYAFPSLDSSGYIGYGAIMALIFMLPLFILSLILFYFYRKKRNLIVESIIIILWSFVVSWMLYEIVRFISKPYSHIKVDLEGFSIFGFGSFLLVIMLISFFKFRKTISS